MLTPEQMNDLLEQAKPSIIEGLKQQVFSSFNYTMKEEAAKVIRDHVTVWVKDNIIPEITKQLVESKDGLIKTGLTLAQSLCDLLMESMVKELGKKLQNSWERTKILEAMFK
jgi:hypothetical protein